MQSTGRSTTGAVPSVQSRKESSEHPGKGGLHGVQVKFPLSLCSVGDACIKRDKDSANLAKRRHYQNEPKCWKRGKVKPRMFPSADLTHHFEYTKISRAEGRRQAGHAQFSNGG